MNIAKPLRALAEGGLVPLLRWPRFSATSYLLAKQLRAAGVTPSSVIDAGANVGQFAVAAAKLLGRPNIIAFEPTPECFRELRKSTAGLDVECVAAALGSIDGSMQLNVNVDSRSNSILDPTELNLSEFSGAQLAERQSVEVVRLDSFLRGRIVERPTLLKVDTQGYEMEVLRGAGAYLQSVDWILVELSFEPMYRGEKRADEVLAWLRENGWRLVKPLDFLTGRGGSVLQMDALLVPDR